MVKLKAVTFDEVVTLAGDFVTEHRGEWDNAESQGFLSKLALMLAGPKTPASREKGFFTLRKRGFDLSEEMQACVRQLLEALRGVYQSTGSTQGLSGVLTAAGKDNMAFIKAHKLIWGSSEWEAYAEHIKYHAQSLTEETSNYLGDVLDSVKVLYRRSSHVEPRAEQTPVTAVEKKPAKIVAARVVPVAEEVPVVETAPVTEKAPVVEKVPVAQKVSSVSPALGAGKVSAAPQAPGKAAEVEKAPVAEKPPADDDLTLIFGIGPALQKKLYDHGIRRFAQIAALSSTEIEQLEGTVIKFPGRIERDGWVAQAQRLAEGLD